MESAMLLVRRMFTGMKLWYGGAGKKELNAIQGTQSPFGTHGDSEWAALL